MNDDDKKRIAELNAAADKRADSLLDLLKASPYSALIMLGAMLAAFFLGFWAGR